MKLSSIYKFILINNILSVPTVNVTECSLVFRYKKIYYAGCTDADSEGAPWCLLKETVDDSSWGYCDKSSMTNYLADDQGVHKNCDPTTSTEDGKSYGCFSTNEQKSYSCNSNGKLIPCLIALPGHKSEFRRPDADKRGYDYTGYLTNLNRTTPDMNAASQADPISGQMSMQVIIILSIVGGLVLLLAVALFIFRRARNRAARLALEEKLHSTYTSKTIASTRRDQSFKLDQAFYSRAQLQECKVITTYTPVLPDELVIRPGDRVALFKIYDDGWVQGANLTRGGAKGVFPLNHLEPLCEPL